MPLKKTALSILMILLFGSYAAYEQVGAQGVAPALAASSDPAAQPAAAPQTTSAAPPPSNNAAQTQIAYQTAVSGEGGEGGEGEGDDGRRSRRTTSTQSAPAQPQRTQQAAQPAQQAAPQSQPTPAPAPQGQYKDGTYTGPSVYVYYGNVQVQATISGGKLAGVQFLQYPNSHGTSVYINDQAMPLLTQEAIQAQSANISGVSGASDTSAGFVQSLGSALSQAHV